jgi:hypothetical protein
MEKLSNETIFAFAQKRKLHHVLYSILTKNNVNILDSQGNSPMYYYIVNAKVHCRVTIETFIENGGQIIVNHVLRAFPYKTNSPLL